MATEPRKNRAARKKGERQTEMEKAINTLETARAAYDAAKQTAETSRRDATLRLNELNTAQEKVDTLVLKMQKEAPSGTKWGDRRRTGEI